MPNITPYFRLPALAVKIWETKLLIEADKVVAVETYRSIQVHVKWILHCDLDGQFDITI